MRPSIVIALRRPALVAIVLGVSLAMSATGRVSPALVLGTTMTWAYVVLLQMAIALPLLASRARRGVGLARALDLFFAGHAPWSLFVLAVGATMPPPAGWPVRPYLELSALVPLALTARIVAAFFREVLGFDRRAARRMTIVHQTMTWSVFLAVNWVSSAFTPRLLELWRL